MVFKQPDNLPFDVFSQAPTLRRSGLLFCGLLSFVILGALLTNYAFADFNMPAVGAWGCNSNTQKTVNNINSKGPERVLALGDYS